MAELTVELNVKPHPTQWLDLMPDGRLYNSNMLWIEDYNLDFRFIDRVLQFALQHNDSSPHRFFGLMFVQQPVGYAQFIKLRSFLIGGNMRW
jgi:hypothetical protein